MTTFFIYYLQLHFELFKIEDPKIDKSVDEGRKQITRIQQPCVIHSAYPLAITRSHDVILVI